MAVSRINNALFVINPISGDIEKGSVITEIKTFCITEKINASFFCTTGSNDLGRLKAELQKLRYDVVIAVGGDGTVHLAGSALIHSQLPLGILPMGSGNGLSKDTGIPQELSGALKVLTNPAIRPIDTLSINNHVCVHLTDLGFNAQVVKFFNQGESRGVSSYAFVALREYLSYKPRHYRIETADEIFEGPAFMVTATNANAFGSNATINPSGIIDDGKFEICLIEPFPKTAALEILYRLYHDSIHISEYTRIISCSQATIFNFSQDEAQVDGEEIALGSRIAIEIQAKSLKLLVPAGGRS